jgi:hypothetical protein
MDTLTTEKWKAVQVLVNNGLPQWHIHRAKLIHQWGKPSIAVVDTEAHAMLMAAAPELLDGAEEVVEWLDLVKQNYPDMDGLIRGMKHLKAVIAKAKATAHP